MPFLEVLISLTTFMNLTYYHHSGFSAAVEDILLVFDYRLGEHRELPADKRINENTLRRYREVYVFISHEHPDHMDPEVFEWRKIVPVTYVVSMDMPIGTRGKRMAPGDTLTLSQRVKVKAFGSTDLGVSFLVDVCGIRLFHAGDLNFWHWREESTVKEIEEAEEAFRRAVDPIMKEDIDVAFFPVDPRQGRLFDAGANYFIMSVKPRLLIPMHFWGRAEIAVEFALGGKTCHLGGIAKGSGMIHPNMATMLVFLTTDAAIAAEMLQKALSGDVAGTFNMVSIDGDTSTNDMVTILANGMAGNAEITCEGADFTAFMTALNTVTVQLCRCIAGDGEGATKLLECKVEGAKDLSTARTVAKSVICSSLLKAAMFGADANWVRVLCAIGYSGADVNVNRVDVAFKSPKGIVEVCKNGAGVPFSEEEAKLVLLEKEIEILVQLNSGDAEATAWGCDLTYDYVKINGDYRT